RILVLLAAPTHLGDYQPTRGDRNCQTLKNRLIPAKPSLSPTLINHPPISASRPIVNASWLMN
ncbi:MAG: hypothetical protein VCB82_06720, partial [Alphaproteobacteria bacterium]